MAITNRYTQGSVSQFNPLSLQEIMMVPTIKRQQHDQLAADTAALEMLLGKNDPHALDYEYAKSIRDELQGGIDNTISELDKNGINSVSKTNVLGLRKKIADEMGPMGRLGQMDSYKKQLAKTREDYIKAGEAMKQDATVVARRFDQEFGEHAKQARFSDKGVINSFSPQMLPPEYIDGLKLYMDYGKSVGMTESEIQRAGESIQYVPNLQGGDGMFMVKSGSDVTTGGGNNHKQLESLAAMMTADMLDPTSKLYRSMKYAGEDPRALLTKIQLGSQALAKSKVIDKRSSSQSVSRLYGSDSNDGGGSSTNGQNLQDSPNYDIGQVKYAKTPTEKLIAGMVASDNLRGVKRDNLPLFGKETGMLSNIKGGGKMVSANSTPYLTVSQKEQLKKDPNYANIAGQLIARSNNKKIDPYSVEGLNMVKNYYEGISKDQNGKRDRVFGERALSPFETKNSVIASSFNKKFADSTSEGMANRLQLEGDGLKVYDRTKNDKAVTMGELKKQNGEIKDIKYHGTHNPGTMSTTGTVMDDFVTIEFANKTKKTIRVPKSSQAQTSSEYKAAKTFNSVLVGANTLPTIPTTYDTPAGKISVTSNSDGNYTLKAGNSQAMPVTESELETIITNIYR